VSGMLAVLGYGVLVIGALALEGAARTRQRGATVADALAAAMRTTPGRAVVLLAWLWVGVHFLAR
jgi:hypothetical protein